MKKYVLIVVSLCVLSCNEKSDEVKIAQDSDVIEINNLNNTGVNFKIQDTGLTRSGCFEEYYIEAETLNDTLVLEGIITIETDVLGNKTVSLYESVDYLADDIFLGSYTIDECLQVIDVEVGDDHFDVELGLQVRKPGESNRDCIRREYNEMKAAYESRPLDDLACTVLFGGILCKTLALIAAGVECDKTA